MPKPLDSLYGKGTSKAFSEACGASAVEVETDLGVRVNVEWKDGSLLKVECRPDEVNFLTLRSEREGLYSDLCDTLPELFKKRGVETFTARPATPESEAILRKRGDWHQHPKRAGLRWII